MKNLSYSIFNEWYYYRIVIPLSNYIVIGDVEAIFHPRTIANDIRTGLMSQLEGPGWDSLENIIKRLATNVY